MNPQEEKNWAIAANLAPLVLNHVTGFGWVAALVIWLTQKDKSRFVGFHALQALILQGVVFVAFVACLVLTLTIVGIVVAIPLAIAAWMFSVIVPIIGAVKASNGEWWPYPLIGDWALSQTR